MKGCDEELCPNWSGDGMVCPCALFDLEPSRVCEVCRRTVPLNDIDYGICGRCRELAGAVDEDGPVLDERDYNERYEDAVNRGLTIYGS